MPRRRAPVASAWAWLPGEVAHPRTIRSASRKTVDRPGGNFEGAHLCRFVIRKDLRLDLLSRLAAGEHGRAMNGPDAFGGSDGCPRQVPLRPSGESNSLSKIDDVIQRTAVGVTAVVPNEQL